MYSYYVPRQNVIILEQNGVLKTFVCEQVYIQVVALSLELKAFIMDDK